MFDKDDRRRDVRRLDDLLKADLPVEQKHAVLASCASDLHAVENAPALRRLFDGTIVHIDVLLEALKRLDRADEPRLAKELHRKAPWRSRNDDDDDDPPPAPCGASRPPLVPEIGGAAVAAA